MPCFASVPVTINDNGDIFKTTIVAGSVAIQASPSDVLTTLQPLSGWWIYKDKEMDFGNSAGELL